MIKIVGSIGSCRFTRGLEVKNVGLFSTQECSIWRKWGIFIELNFLFLFSFLFFTFFRGTIGSRQIIWSRTDRLRAWKRYVEMTIENRNLSTGLRYLTFFKSHSSSSHKRLVILFDISQQSQVHERNSNQCPPSSLPEFTDLAEWKVFHTFYLHQYAPLNESSCTPWLVHRFSQTKRTSRIKSRRKKAVVSSTPRTFWSVTVCEASGIIESLFHTIKLSFLWCHCLF